jgi:hypothetical protein
VLVFSSFPFEPGETVNVRIIAPDGLPGELILYGDKSGELARRSADVATGNHPAWIIPVARDEKYHIQQVADGIHLQTNDLEDLSTTKDDPYEFTFQPG